MTKEQKAKEIISQILHESYSYEDWVQCIGEELEEYADKKAQSLVGALENIVRGSNGKLAKEDRNRMLAIAHSALASYAGSAEGEKEPSFQAEFFLAKAEGRIQELSILVYRLAKYLRKKECNEIESRLIKEVDEYLSNNWSPLDVLRSDDADSGKEPEKKDPWISVEDRPLINKCEDGTWFAMGAGNGEFLAAVPYKDAKQPGKNLWWIKHCIIDGTEDGAGLCVVGEYDNEPAGWEIEDIQYYFPLPKPPAATNQEGGVS